MRKIIYAVIKQNTTTETSQLMVFPGGPVKSRIVNQQGINVPNEDTDITGLSPMWKLFTKLARLCRCRLGSRSDPYWGLLAPLHGTSMDRSHSDAQQSLTFLMELLPQAFRSFRQGDRYLRGRHYVARIQSIVYEMNGNAG